MSASTFFYNQNVFLFNLKETGWNVEVGYISVIFYSYPKSGHFNVSWNVCAEFVYKNDVVGHVDRTV